MKGLLIKDIINLKRMLKTYLGLFAFYLAFAIFTKSTDVMGTVCMIISIMLPMTSLSFDETYHWNELVYSMPVSKRTVVLSKYLQSLAFTLASVVICIAISGVISLVYPAEISFSAGAVSIAVIGLLGMLLIDVMLPLLFKFGVEKGRVLVMVCVMLPMAAVFVFKDHLGELTRISGPVLLAGVIGLIAVATVASVDVSIQICKKKEY